MVWANTQRFNHDLTCRFFFFNLNNVCFKYLTSLFQLKCWFAVFFNRTCFETQTILMWKICISNIAGMKGIIQKGEMWYNKFIHMLFSVSHPLIYNFNKHVQKINQWDSNLSSTAIRAATIPTRPSLLLDNVTMNMEQIHKLKILTLLC